MNENKNVLKYEYEVLKVGDADAILTDTILTVNRLSY